MDKIAGAIITFSRPHYYKQQMDSLEQCENANNISWYVYQDGFEFHPKNTPSYSNLTLDKVEKNIEITNNSKLNIVNHDINKYNFGVNYQINKIVKLFDEGYDTLFIFEDDLIVSKNYLNLLYQCSKEHPNVLVSFHSVNLGKKKDLKCLVKSKVPRMWGFYLTKKVWNSISDNWHNFYNESTPRICRQPFYDTVFTQSVRKYTKGKYEPLVSRSINVGIEGNLAIRPTNWKKKNLHLQSNNIEYEEDETMKGFILK